MSFVFCVGGISALLFASMSLYAGPVSGDDGDLAAIMRLVGAAGPEDIGEEMYDHYSALLEHPLRINIEPSGKLEAAGIFTPYQTATIVDYRSRHGDILSFSELALVDGFSESDAERFAPFISLESASLPGRTVQGKSVVENDADIRGGLKISDGNPGYMYGVRYRLSSGSTDMGLTLSRTYSGDAWWPGTQSAYYAYYGTGLKRLVVGDYSLRYGQGLAVWTGFSMSGVGTVSSLYRTPSGIAPYRSWSGGGRMRGVAADIAVGRWNISTSMGIDGINGIAGDKRRPEISLSPVVNAAYSGRESRFSLTFAAQTEGIGTGRNNSGTGRLPGYFSDMKVAADFAYCFRGTDFFSEAALDILSLSPAVIAGGRSRLADGLLMAVCTRYYPASYSSGMSGALRSSGKCSNEYGVTAAGDFFAGRKVQLMGREGFGSSVDMHMGTFSLDAVYYPEKRTGMSAKTWQLKAAADYDLQISPSVCVSLRLSERFRTSGDRHRTEMRCDLAYAGKRWGGSLRMDVLRCRSLSALSYLEGAYSSDIVSASMRFGCFIADNWADRIYVYERGIPGSFNVPAFYGRGCWASAYCRVRLSGWLRLYFRASAVAYPWQSPENRKPGRAELSLCLSVRLH